MTKECFIRYFKLQFYLYKFPVRIYEGDELLEAFDPAPIESEKIAAILDYALQEHLSLTKNSMQMYQSEHYIAYVTIKNEGVGLSALLGPIRTVHLDEKEISEIAAANDVSCSEMQHYFDSLPFMPIGLLSILLSSYSISVNGVIVKDSDLYDNIMNLKKDQKLESSILRHEERVAYEEEVSFNGAASEKQILYFVQNGMLQELKQLWQQIFPEREISKYYGSVREVKNHCLLSLGILSLTSMNTGMSHETNFDLRNNYSRKIESCTTAREVIDLRYQMLCDFTERNAQAKLRMPDDPFIERTIHYVLENVEKPITLAEICGRLNTNKSYFCTKFKEVMGTGFTDFVNTEKVKKAKQLLLFTDKPLIEIANFLSFSSQGYFQIVFKKITGVTPSQFRKSGGK